MTHRLSVPVSQSPRLLRRSPARPAPRAVALISGGLDSMLAARLMLEQGVEVEGLNFFTGFCVEGLEPGAVLEVSCTDPGARDDIPAWCRVNGHEVLGVVEDAHGLVVSLRVGASP